MLERKYIMILIELQMKNIESVVNNKKESL